MCTSQVALMDLGRGTVARIDRRLLADLGNNEAFPTLRVPATAAKWATWMRYCGSLGISMGRAVAKLIDSELVSVFGERTAGARAVSAQQAIEQLAIREAKFVAREREVDTEEARMREWSGRLRRREDDFEARELRTEDMSKLVTRPLVGSHKDWA